MKVGIFYPQRRMLTDLMIPFPSTVAQTFHEPPALGSAKEILGPLVSENELSRKDINILLSLYCARETSDSGLSTEMNRRSPRSYTKCNASIE